MGIEVRREGFEVVGVVQVVGGKIGDERRGRQRQRAVERGAKADIGMQARVSDPVVVQVASDQVTGPVGRSVIDDDQLPGRHRLGAHTLDRPSDERRLHVCRHED